MIRHVAILDVETGGLDSTKDPCVEVAIILYDLLGAAPVASFASLIQGNSNDAVAINRISMGLLPQAPPADVVWRRVTAIIESAEAFVAHRASFDMQFIPEPLRSSKPWVCSKFHIDWPDSELGAGLVYAALAHGVGIVNAHRAMTDCDILSRLLTRVGERMDLQLLFQRAMRPRNVYVSFAPFEQKDLVKSNGFSWDDPVPGQWAREIPPEDVSSLPFRAVEWSTCKLFVANASYEQRETVKSFGFTWTELVPKQWAKMMPPSDAAELPFRVSEYVKK